MANGYRGVIELHGPRYLTNLAALDLVAKAHGYDLEVKPLLPHPDDLLRFAFESRYLPDIGLHEYLCDEHPFVRVVFRFVEKVNLYPGLWDSDAVRYDSGPALSPEEAEAHVYGRNAPKPKTTGAALSVDEALAIVLDLAEENALDPDDDDPMLRYEAERQQTALGIVNGLRAALV